MEHGKANVMVNNFLQVLVIVHVAPMVLYQSALDFASTYPIDPDFVVYVGDNIAHDDWEQSREINLDYAKVVHDALRVSFPKKLVLSTIGNHDSYRMEKNYL